MTCLRPVCGWILQVLAALGLLVTGTTKTAETRNGLCALHVNILVLGVLADPRDHDVIVVSEDEVHSPVAVEAPLAHFVILARITAHPDSARLAPSISQLVDHPIKVLLDLSPKSFHARVAAPRNGHVEPWCHVQTRVTLALRSELHGVAGQSVLQTFSCSGLLQGSLVGGLSQKL